MNTLRTFASTLMNIVSLLTACGVFMHDGRVDRATVTALHRPFEAVQVQSPLEMTQRVKAFVETDAHTHPDHNAARSSLMNSFTYQSPSVPPRKEDRHRLSYETDCSGRHAFDNVNLPIIG